MESYEGNSKSYQWGEPIVALIAAAFVSVSVCSWGMAQDALDEASLSEAIAEDTVAASDMSLEEIDQQLNNPLTSLWSLTLQENFSLKQSKLFDGTQTANTLFFQPAFPIPFGDEYTFIARPVFPLVTSPVPDANASDGFTGHETDLGDIQTFVLFGPDKAEGLTWGVGATFIFPTAGLDLLGQGQYQAGPAAMVLNLGERWTTGFVLQHWWGIDGDANHTDLQYILRRKLPGAMSLGMGPTISVDWEADSDNRLNLPIGLGITKTVRIGAMPFKLRFEPQYSIISPDDFGTEWNFRIQVTPVIRSPFSR